MAKRHRDELAHERRRAKIPRTSRQGQPDQLRLGRRSAVFDHGRRPGKRVLPNQSELMRKVLSQKGADSKLIVVKGADRGEPQWAQKQISDILSDF